MTRGSAPSPRQISTPRQFRHWLPTFLSALGQQGGPMAVGLLRASCARTALPLALFVGVLLSAGCSEQSSAERLSPDSPLGIELSQMSVTVENKAGLALSEVSMTIDTYSPIKYTKRMDRMENT